MRACARDARDAIYDIARHPDGDSDSQSGLSQLQLPHISLLVRLLTRLVLRTESKFLVGLCSVY